LLRSEEEEREGHYEEKLITKEDGGVVCDKLDRVEVVRRLAEHQH